MFFSDFCSIASSTRMGYESQYRYLKELFKAAKITKNYSDEHTRKLYTGCKPFNKNVKKRFNKTLPLKPVTDFFEKHINDDDIDELVDTLAIPKELERNKRYLAYALAKQFKEFIISDDEANNIIIEAYAEARIEEKDDDIEITESLYENDYPVLDNTPREYTANCYDKITHTWSIQNYSKCVWKNRKLVLINENNIKPRFNKKIIEIPETLPYKFVKISTTFNCRGQEGEYLSKWEMQDSSGNNCFPNSRNVFDIKIKVSFSSTNSEDKS